MRPIRVMRSGTAGISILHYNPADVMGAPIFSALNKTMEGGGVGSDVQCRGYIGRSTGRWYVEYVADVASANATTMAFGIVASDFAIGSSFYNNATNSVAIVYQNPATNGWELYAGGASISTAATGSLLGTQVIGVYVDMHYSATEGYVAFYKNGTFLVGRIFTHNGKTYHPIVWLKGQATHSQVTLRVLDAEMTQRVGTTYRCFSQDPTGTAWTPGDLPYPMVFYDADTAAGTLVLSGSNVATWNSSTLFGLDAARLSQGTGANQPTTTSAYFGGRRAPLFNGTTQYLGGDTYTKSLSNAASAMTVFAAYRIEPADVSGVERCLTQISTNSAAAARMGLKAGQSAAKNKPLAGGRRADADSFASCSTAIEYTGDQCVIADYDYANSDVNLYMNGTLDGSNTSFQTNGSTSATNSAAFIVGAEGSASSQWMKGPIQMIAQMRGQLTSGERAKLAAYMSYVSGLGGSAPTY